MDRIRTRFLLPVIGVAALSLGAAPAGAETCPGDLTGLGGQITTPQLQARLSAPLGDLVEDAGGLTQAIARTTAAIETAQALRTQRVPAGRDVTELDEAVLVLQSQLSALTCRQQSQS